METKQDYQIINGEKWPQFPFYAKNKRNGFVHFIRMFDYVDNVFRSNFHRIDYDDAEAVEVTKCNMPLPEKDDLHKSMPMYVKSKWDEKVFYAQRFNHEEDVFEQYYQTVSREDVEPVIVEEINLNQ